MKNENSNQMDEESGDSERNHFYVLYVVTRNGTYPKNSISNEIDEEMMDSAFKMTLVHSDAPVELTESLTSKIQRQIATGNVPVGYSVTNKMKLPLSEENMQEFGVYSINLATMESTKDATIVLLHNDWNIIETFHAELDEFCKTFQDTIKSKLPTGCIDPILETLAHWPENSVDAIPRGIRLLGAEILPAFLFAILCDRTLIVDSVESNSNKTDLERLYDMCSVEKSLTKPKSIVDSSATDEMERKPIIFLNCKNNSVTISENTSNSFSCKWAEVLMKASVADPPLSAVAKHLIFVFKQKAIQDLNAMKRLLILAENDHYALYKTLEFLRKSQNYESLIELIKIESRANADHLAMIEILTRLIET